MKGLDDNDVVKLLMDLSYQAAMIAVDIETDKAAGMERLLPGRQCLLHE